jgi:hypothetical protein
MLPKVGREPYPTLVAERALATPDRVYSVIPKTDSLDDGYKNFTHGQLARAVDRMSWWLDQELGPALNFPTFAYLGASDHRYTILWLAASKTRRQVAF